MSEAEDTYGLIAARLSLMPGVVQGHMFGMPSVMVNGKAFAGLHQDSMVFKLSGAPHTQALGVEGASLFDPQGRGRPMKEWVCIPLAQSSNWENFADEAFRYVAGLTP